MPAADAHHLDRPIDPSDHALGSAQAGISLVEYGSYACPHCRAANRVIADLRDRFGDQLRYVFRHRPLTGSDLARRAAELVERVEPERFWDAHVELMTRSEHLTEAALAAVGSEFGVDARDDPYTTEDAPRRRTAAPSPVEVRRGVQRGKGCMEVLVAVG